MPYASGNTSLSCGLVPAWKCGTSLPGAENLKRGEPAEAWRCALRSGDARVKCYRLARDPSKVQERVRVPSPALRRDCTDEPGPPGSSAPVTVRADDFALGDLLDELAPAAIAHALGDVEELVVPEVVELEDEGV